jgi:hypothetical protein
MLIIGFDIEEFDRKELDSCSEEELCKKAADNPHSTITFGSPSVFCNGINDECINTDGFWFYVVNKKTFLNTF